MLELVDFRKIDSKQLWTVGCSISHGIGVTSDQRYGQLLSNELNLPVSFLTQGGSSVIWAADQILRSDIRCNDLVVWGLTSMPRVPCFNDNKLTHVNVNSYNKNPELDQIFAFKYFTSEDITYRTVISMFQVVNYCKKIGANLLFVSLFKNDELVKYLLDHANLLQVKCKDLGSDYIHPGPASHKFFSEEISNKIKQLQWI